MKLDFMDREKGLELLGKFIRTKNVENLQGEHTRAGSEQIYSTGSKQKLQVKSIL
jgi:cationic amino acid transporter 14